MLKFLNAYIYTTSRSLVLWSHTLIWLYMTYMMYINPRFDSDDKVIVGNLFLVSVYMVIAHIIIDLIRTYFYLKNAK